MFANSTGFQLIDEPTNHLDIEGRKVVADYLRAKKDLSLSVTIEIFLTRSLIMSSQSIERISRFTKEILIPGKRLRLNRISMN